MNPSQNGAAAPANQTSVDSMRGQLAPRAQQPEQDYAIDFFSARGFALAQRLATAFATSNAVPAAFRNFTEKKTRNGVEVIENPSAMGNCLVAIETARAVGMSITAVMQNANVIEGRLSWSGKFVIAAINASGRFTPLRFDIKNKGPIKATYKEKQGWNDQKRGFDFKDITVDVENLECIAWALPGGMVIPNNVRTLDQARAANLPVIESAPVSMKLAVEEGWYGKSGSKWQTELKHLMLQYRAGSFFGNIHAPDIVMGMGRSQEEIEDVTTVEVQPDGRVQVTTEELRRPTTAPAPAEVVGQINTTGSGEEHPPEGHEPAGEKANEGAKPAAAEGAAAGQQQEQAQEPLTFAVVADAIAKSTTAIELQAALALIPRVKPEEQQPELNGIAQRREAELNGTPAAQPRARRAAGARNSVE